MIFVADSLICLSNACSVLQFLSMKLSSVNTRLDFNMDALMSKEVGFMVLFAPQNYWLCIISFYLCLFVSNFYSELGFCWF